MDCSADIYLSSFLKKFFFNSFKKQLAKVVETWCSNNLIILLIDIYRHGVHDEVHDERAEP